MNWQERMKHSIGCPARDPYKASREYGISLQPAPAGKCTCRRDETVAAIEAVVEALRDISKSRGCFVRRSQELGGESMDYMDGCEIAYERCADAADAALDRLNALAGGASGKEGE